MKVGSLFSGCGGLDLGLELAGHDIIWQAESDRAASIILTKHWPDTPNFGDVRSIDWAQVERPDIIAAGFPCPDFSAAGRKAGIGGEQGQLWFEVERCIRILNPMQVLLENVPGILTAPGLPEHPGESAVGVVLASLAEGGYMGSWSCLRASDFGACHRRERWFAIAYAAGEGGWEESRGAPEHEATQNGSTSEANYVFGSASQGRFQTTLTADPHLDSSREQEPEMASKGSRERAAGDKNFPADALSMAGPTPGERYSRSGASSIPRPRGDKGEEVDGATGRSGIDQWGIYWPAIAHWENISGQRAPRPTEAGRLRPEFVEWMMGFPEGWTEGVAKTNRLACLGNAVFVPISEHLGAII